MKKSKKIMALLLSTVILTGALTACNNKNSKNENLMTSSQENIESVDQKEQKTEDQSFRDITDMAGRSVKIPDAKDIKSVFSADPATSIFMYIVDPDRLLGWNYELNDLEKSVIPEKYQNLPNFGMRDKTNYEAVIKENPTIAIICGKINDQIVSDCDKLSEKLGIPVLAVDSDLENSKEAFKFMGEVLGVEKHTDKLIAYTEKTFENVKTLSTIKDEDKIRVYYGNGENSLETAPKNSPGGKIFDIVNAKNVADVESVDNSRVEISAEQLLSWDPDVIVLNGEPKSDISGVDAAKKIMEDSNFSSLKAVKNKKVYGIPNAPFGWVERPSGPNRIIGISWLLDTLYPDKVDTDTNKDIKDFFKLFYHTDIDDEKIDKLLNGKI